MKTIRWRDICGSGERMHVATIESGRMATPAMHAHDFYECFVVLEGSGEELTSVGTQPLQPCVIHFVRPEHAHAIRGRDDLAFLNLAFESRLFDATIALAELPPECWQRGAAIHSVSITRSQVDQIVDLVTEVARERSARQAAWMLLSLARVLEPASGAVNASAGMPGWLADGLDRARDPEVLRFGLPALARRMGRTREHLARSFRQFVGLTPTQWLNEERIQRAQLLLATTRLSVLEIALDCGFESPSHFHKCFRESTGTTPLKYRTQLTRVQR